MNMRSTISPSPISLSLAPLSLWSFSLSLWLLCVAFACATSLNQIEHCEVDSASATVDSASATVDSASATVDGLNVVEYSQGLTLPSRVEEKGEDAIKEYLDSLFSNALFGTDSTETAQNKETHPDSYAIQSDSITQIKDQDKSASKPAKEAGEEQKLTIPSHIEKEGQDAIKKYLDNLFSNALFGSDSIETGQNQEAHSDSYSIQLDSKTQIQHEDERNMNAKKSSYKFPKKAIEEPLSDGDIAVNVDLEIVGDGEYVLKIKRVNPSSTNEDEVERAKHMAQNGAMLLHHGEILQDMGEKLLVQSQALLYSVFKMPAPPKFKSDQ